MSLADKLKSKNRIHWTTLRGEKIGLRLLSRNEMKQYIGDLESAPEDDERGVFGVFAPMVLDADGKQALTVAEMEDILSDAELRDLLQEFNKANGFVADDAEKN